MSFSLVSFLCLGGRLFDFCQVLHDYNVFVRFKYIVAYFVYKIFVDVRSLFPLIEANASNILSFSLTH